MPGDVALEQTVEQVMAVEQRVLSGLREGEARSVTSLAGVQFTDVEPLFGDQYGQVVVSLNPANGGRTVEAIIEGMRESVLATPIDGDIAFLQISGGPPTQQPINVKVRSDDFGELRRATDRLRELIAELPGTRDVTDDRVPGRSELVLDLDREALAQVGLAPEPLARLLRCMSTAKSSVLPARLAIATSFGSRPIAVARRTRPWCSMIRSCCPTAGSAASVRWSRPAPARPPA
jgi:multidrug efflux pump subunit AcrB